jgi:hypothetical protein
MVTEYLPTTTIRSLPGEAEENVLYNQQFMMYPNSNRETVSNVLRQRVLDCGLQSPEERSYWDVLGFLNWPVGKSESA